MKDPRKLREGKVEWRRISAAEEGQRTKKERGMKKVQEEGLGTGEAI